MLRFLYTILLYLSLPLICFRLWYKGRKNPGYRARILERFGFSPFKCEQAIWLHAVSLGETVAAIPLIEELLKIYPDMPCVITTTTPTGSAKVRQHFADRVLHCYFPYDLPSFWRRFFKRINPKFILIMETELWPNLLNVAEQKQRPVMLVNGRISDLSIKEYRYLKPFVGKMLRKIKIIAAQSALDAERFEELGALPKHIINTGNLKFDAVIAEPLVDAAKVIRAQLKKSPIWIAASTHKGEEDLILSLHQQVLAVHPEALLILVPRHPERFDEVARLCAAGGFSYLRKSSGKLPGPAEQVFLGDSMGELQFYYALADVAFVGGTLVPIGGHNPLEALILGKKVLSGQYTNNAKNMYDELQAAGLVQCFSDLEVMKEALLEALNTPLDQNYVEQYMQRFQGVKGRVLALIAAPGFQV